MKTDKEYSVHPVLLVCPYESENLVQTLNQPAWPAWAGRRPQSYFWSEFYDLWVNVICIVYLLYLSNHKDPRTHNQVHFAPFTKKVCNLTWSRLPLIRVQYKEALTEQSSLWWLVSILLNSADNLICTVAPTLANFYAFYYEITRLFCVVLNRLNIKRVLSICEFISINLIVTENNAPSLSLKILFSNLDRIKQNFFQI